MEKIQSIVSSVTFRRIIILFIIGLVLRTIVNNVYNLNVFKEYTNIISLSYYGFMVIFTGFIYELNPIPKIDFNVFNLNLIKSALKTFLSKCLDWKFGNKMMTGVDYKGGDLQKIGELDKEKSYLNQDRSKSEKDFDIIVKGKKKWTREAWENRDIDKLEELHKERERKRERKYRKLGLRLTSDTLSSSERLEVQRARKDYLNFDQNSLIDLNSSKDQNKLRGGRVINKEDERNVSFNQLNDSSKFKQRLYWYCWKQFSKDFGSYQEYSDYLKNKNIKFSIREKIKKGIFKR